MNVDNLFKASLGQYGSSYLNGNGDIVDLNGTSATRYVIAITFMEQTSFTALQNINGEIGSISTVTAENDHDNVDLGFGEAGNATDLTTSHNFLAGTTIYGKWDYVELNAGSCVCYFAPRGV
tara:strand:- start:9529 stop:9894 length:366 start_codon:yes stop_codon:yes gene_type:complete